ncbi:MAG: hypothetical protein II219_02050, partial [Alphaproteobacteria bacterium]|nr:hypothetical protein [Alphaproteobacteria bacterium]
ETGKRKLKYEIMEEIERYLNSKVEQMQSESEYNTNPENWSDGEIPQWRLDDVEANKVRMAIIGDILNGLLKI